MGRRQDHWFLRTLSTSTGKGPTDSEGGAPWGLLRLRVLVVRTQTPGRLANCREPPGLLHPHPHPCPPRVRNQLREATGEQEEKKQSHLACPELLTVQEERGGAKVGEPHAAAPGGGGVREGDLDLWLHKPKGSRGSAVTFGGIWAPPVRAAKTKPHLIP